MPRPPLHPLIAARLARPALLLSAILLMLVAALALRYAGQHTPGAIDRALDPLAWLTLRDPWFNNHSPFFTKIADARPAAFLVGCGTAVALALRRWSGALLVLIGTGLSVGLVKLLLKPLVDRHYGAFLSFPSTHVTVVASVAIALTVVLISAPWPRWRPVRIAASVPPLAGAGGTTLAVVAARTHYTTDVLAAWCFALAVVLVTALTIDTIWRVIARNRHDRADWVMPGRLPSTVPTSADNP